MDQNATTLLAQNVPTRIAAPVQQFTQQLEAPQIEQQGQQNLDAMTRELFNADKQLEGQYAQSPYPQVEGYVDNPADLARGYANYASGMAGNITRGQGVLSDISSGYDRATSAILDKFINFYTLQEQKRQAEEDRKYQKQQDQLEFELALAKLTGGTVTNPFTGEKINVPAPGGSEDQLDKMIPIDVAIQYGLPIGSTYRDLQGQKINAPGESIGLEESAKYGLPYGTPLNELQGKTISTLAGTDDKTQKEIKNVELIQELIKNVEKEYNDVSALSKGQVMGRLTSGLRGFQPEAQQYEQYINSIASVLARGLFSETGTMNEGDIQRAKESLPTLTDTPQKAMDKLANLRNLTQFKVAQLTNEPYVTQESAKAPGFFASLLGAKPTYANGNSYKVGSFIVEEE